MKSNDKLTKHFAPLDRTYCAHNCDRFCIQFKSDLIKVKYKDLCHNCYHHFSRHSRGLKTKS